MSDHVAELRERIERLVGEVLHLNDAEFVYFMSEVCDRRPPDPQPVDFEQEHFFLGLAYRQRADEEASERWGPWEVQAVAPPDAAFYAHRGPAAFLGYDSSIDEHGLCEGCGTTVRAGSKRVACPICGAGVSLT